MESGKLCFPGEQLFKAGDEYSAGFGTYVVHGYIYSALAGYLKLSLNHSEKCSRVDIEPAAPAIVLPSVGDVVTCKVVGTFSRYVKCTVHCVRNQLMTHPFSGAIRKEDVVELDKHKVDLFKSFRTGDVLLAKVLGFGDTSSYLLSTAEDALGVIWGRCPQGHKMMPLNAQEIHCASCDVAEPRKVAKLVEDSRGIIADTD